MPDYYTRFAICIPLRTEAEQAWWKAASHIYVPMLWGGESPDDVAEGKAFFAKYPELWANHEGSTICEIRFEADPRFAFGAVYVMDDNGVGVIDGVGSLIQAFLTDCDIKKPVAFMWGEDCDRHRPDGFGGGACLVTRDDVRIQSASGLIDDWVRELTVPTTVNYHDQAPYGVGGHEEGDDAAP